MYIKYILRYIQSTHALCETLHREWPYIYIDWYFFKEEDYFLKSTKSNRGIACVVSLLKGIFTFALDTIDSIWFYTHTHTHTHSHTYAIHSTPRTGYDTRLIFKQSITGLNSEFSFSLTSCNIKVEEPSLPYFLIIAGGRTVGYISFPRVFALRVMQTALSRILILYRRVLFLRRYPLHPERLYEIRKWAPRVM